MPVFHTKIIESILEPVAQQVSAKLRKDRIIYRYFNVLVSRVGVEDFGYCLQYTFSSLIEGLCHRFSW